MDRKNTFFLALAYLVVILLMGLLFFVKRDLLFFVPPNFGPVAVGVPWFGALGAVLISLTGVFEHEHDWDASYWPWHVARPFIGAALGVVSVLILQAGVLAVGSTPIKPTPTPTPAVSTTTSTPAGSTTTSTPAGSTTTSTPAGSTTTSTPAGSTTTSTPAGSTTTSTPAGSATKSTPSGSPTPPEPKPTPDVPTNLLYYLIAFLVGYREETFRELIKRLVDVILSPGNASPPAPTIQGVNPPQVPHGAPTPVVITGTGFTGAQSVKFGDTAAQSFTVDADGQITATPTAVPAAGPVTLKVTTKNGSATKPFNFT
jgi:hypothetical protein